MSKEGEYAILRDLGYITPLKNDVTRLTEKGEKTVARFLEILRED